MTKTLKSFVTTLSPYKDFFLSLFVIGIIVDLLFFKGHSDVRFVGLFLIWLLVVLTYQLKSFVSFIVGLCLAALLLVSYMFGDNPYTQEIAVLLFLMLLFGSVHQFLELRRSPK